MSRDGHMDAMSEGAAGSGPGTSSTSAAGRRRARTQRGKGARGAGARPPVHTTKKERKKTRLRGSSRPLQESVRTGRDKSGRVRPPERLSVSLSTCPPL